jgi:hypothetical protein
VSKVANRATLVTHNVREFRGAKGRKIENWCWFAACPPRAGGARHG